MAKKPTKKPTPIRKTQKRRSPAPKPPLAPPRISATRNTAAPKIPTARSKGVTPEMIAKRAYEIYCSGKGGSETENWLRAERELRGA